MDKVREALKGADDVLRHHSAVSPTAAECREALSVLTAHEQEVRLLIQAARDIAEHNMSYFGEDANTSVPDSLYSKVRFLRSALRPFGDEK